MKIRKSFVTNSSSSSFVIDMSELTPYTVKVFKNPWLVEDQLIPTCDMSREEYMEEAEKWDIREENGKLYGHTFMDNFDYSQLFYICGLDWESHKTDEMAPSLAEELKENLDDFLKRYRRWWKWSLGKALLQTIQVQVT